MGHKSKKSLVRQVQETLQAKLFPGDSKHIDKQTPGTTDGKIYSYNTFRTYLNVGAKFAAYCKEQHGCKNIADCRQYVDEYLNHRSAYCSPYTTKLDASAIAKLYGESSTNFAQTRSRVRSEVTRSRGAKEMDKHFSETKNAELVSFLKSTGLRRSEAACVRGSDIRPCSDSPCGLGIRVRASGAKGGRERIAPLYCSQEVAAQIVNRCSTAGNNKLFDHIHTKLDVHALRAVYAETVYLQNARPLDTLLYPEKYYCRNDMKGVVLDRQAMQITSHALGHNRIQVTTHYLHNLKS